MPYLMRAAPKTSTSCVVQPGDKEKFHRDLLSELCFIEIVVDAIVAVEVVFGCGRGGGSEAEQGRDGTGELWSPKFCFRFSK